MRVVISSPFALARMGMISILSQQEDMTLVGEAISGCEAFLKTKESRADVVVVDGRSESATSDIERIAVEADSARVIVLSSADELPSLEGFLKAGAVGCVQLCEDPHVLVDVIRNVANNGQRSLSPVTAQRLADDLATRCPQTNDVLLNEQDLTTLKQVAEGKTNKQIACALNLSVKATVLPNSTQSFRRRTSIVVATTITRRFAKPE